VAVPRASRILWLSTEKPGYFERFGFERFSKWALPLPILLSKLGLVFQQGPSRWWPLLTGAPIFMRHTRATSPDRVGG
jgi:hypothetical protein